MSTAQDLANLYGDLSTAVSGFQEENQASLSAEEILNLNTIAQTLLNQSASFIGLAIQAKLAGMQDDLNNIVRTTQDAQKAVKHIKDIQKGIGIFTAAVTLGAAILTSNPGAIIGALGGLTTAIAGGGAAPAGGAGGGAAPAAGTAVTGVGPNGPDDGP
jgi:hypothetical protein